MNIFHDCEEKVNACLSRRTILKFESTLRRSVRLSVVRLLVKQSHFVQQIESYYPEILLQL
jgi:hypothetical protein